MYFIFLSFKYLLLNWSVNKFLVKYILKLYFIKILNFLYVHSVQINIHIINKKVFLFIFILNSFEERNCFIGNFKQK